MGGAIGPSEEALLISGAGGGIVLPKLNLRSFDGMRAGWETNRSSFGGTNSDGKSLLRERTINLPICSIVGPILAMGHCALFATDDMP
eukprot:CAMPEP_0169287528 /NCGR_PEP_ID=MMETSP1016-20121227/59963_1 /TAXON_ID=342587 /ORGANISM="Karlodinium micrum, Strain CCMP2283" /LENGTH=87 /DNA_ID=CAMNT_0009377475 /DNA_START=100 /DNA_END=359 /DNA_ORIENTATION=+